MGNKRKKYYGVRVGLEGPKIYTSWEEPTLKKAEEYIARQATPKPTPAAPRDAPAVTPELDLADIPAIPRNDIPKVKLSNAQQQVFNRVKRGQNVFFTGSAGTGKSLLMREIIDYKGGRISTRLAITAATGIAACNIGGTTLHSWAGIGQGIDDGWDFAGKLFGQKTMRHVLERWKEVDTLIIDEVSMMEGELFDALSRVRQEMCARRVRNNDKPFGGIQLILSGDFCQLPPVSKNGKPVKFAFDAESWHRCLGPPVFLTKVFRQKEQEFVDMLNELRFGTLKPETVRKLQALSRPVEYTDGIEPTGLCVTSMITAPV
ncbi:PIF1-like helicase-domain-containing protein [Schizophyllum fasciatum]